LKLTLISTRLHFTVSARGSVGVSSISLLYVQPPPNH